VDRCNPYLERPGEAKEETWCSSVSREMRVKGDSVAGEASGGVVGGGQKADARPGLELCWWCREEEMS